MPKHKQRTLGDNARGVPPSTRGGKAHLTIIEGEMRSRAREIARLVRLGRVEVVATHAEAGRGKGNEHSNRRRKGICASATREHKEQLHKKKRLKHEEGIGADGKQGADHHQQR